MKKGIKVSLIFVLSFLFIFLVSKNGKVEAIEEINRVYGETRFETAAEISQLSYASSDTVFITDAREFADALAGVPLAYQENAPILLAQGDALHNSTITEIQRLGASRAVILGGEAAVSSSIESELESLGLSTERIAGDRRFETAELIAEELDTHISSDQAIVVEGFEFADAMSVAPFAAREGIPIYLTQSHNVTSDQALNQYQSTLVIGGSHAIENVVFNRLPSPTRLAGDTRYETNLAVLNHFGVTSDQLYVATGLDFVDALTGSLLAAHDQSGIALVRGGVTSGLRSYINQQGFSSATILGGEHAVSEEIASQLQAGHTYDIDVRAIEQRIIELTNDLREQHDASALSSHSELRRAGDIRAVELEESFSHDRPDGTAWSTVFDEYNINYSSYLSIGENLAMGTYSGDEIEAADWLFDGWVDSQSHFENMIRPGYQDIGVGVHYDGQYLYLTQIFGQR